MMQTMGENISVLKGHADNKSMASVLSFWKTGGWSCKKMNCVVYFL